MREPTERVKAAKERTYWRAETGGATGNTIIGSEGVCGEGHVKERSPRGGKSGV